MGVYYALILRAVAELEPNTAELRTQVYESARAALTARLQALVPPLSAADRMKARLELEEAFRTVEADVEKAAGFAMTFPQYAHHLHVAEALRVVSGQLAERRHGAAVALTPEGAFGFVLAASEVDRALRRERSEEHTSELQSLRQLVCRLLLEKKKKTKRSTIEGRHKKQCTDQHKQ